MYPHKHELIATAIHANKGEVRGRTYLQKLCFFISKLTGFELNYYPYLYGPYSEEVTSAVDDLVTHSVINEAKNPTLAGAGYDRYLYTLHSPDLVERFEAKQPDQYRKVVEAANRILQTKMARSTRSLSVGAKVLSILSEQGRDTGVSQLVHTAREMGWDIRAEDVADVESSLKALNLIDGN